MPDSNLHNMLAALLKGEKDTAGEILHNRSTEIMSKIVNPPEEPAQKLEENMIAYDIYDGKKLLDTVWYSPTRTTEDVRQALIDDGSAPSITVVKRKPAKKED